MKCLILAAGYATRLYPLTETFPKPLLMVGEKTILDWLVDDLESSKTINEYVVISNHKFVHYFDEWAKDKKYKVSVLDDGTTSNDNRLGAVRDIQFAIEKLNIQEDVLVIAGDNVLDFSLNTFVRYALNKQSSCVMRYFEPLQAKLVKCGVLGIDDSDKVVNMTEKPENPSSNWCCPPFYYYTAEDVQKVEKGILEGCNTDAPGSYVAWLCHKNDVYAMEMPGRRYDIGNLESYEKVQKEYKGIDKC